MGATNACSKLDFDHEHEFQLSYKREQHNNVNKGMVQITHIQHIFMVDEVHANWNKNHMYLT